MRRVTQDKMTWSFTRFEYQDSILIRATDGTTSISQSASYRAILRRFNNKQHYFCANDSFFSKNPLRNFSILVSDKNVLNHCLTYSTICYFPHIGDTTNYGFLCSRNSRIYGSYKRLIEIFSFILYMNECTLILQEL